MSLEKKLAELKRQRAQQVKTLHRTYVRTKRDAKRAISPGRMIRKHLGVSLGVAAVAGLLLAPSPPVRYTVESVPTEQKKRRKGGGMLARVLGLLKMFVPEAAGLIPGLRKTAERATAAVDGEGQQNAGAAPKQASRMFPLLMELAMLLMQKVDWAGLVGMVMQRFRPAKEQASSKGAEQADAGETAEDASQESPPTAN